jgi:hypothetical protein
MRLSQNKQFNIAEAIKKDMYAKAFKELDKKQENLVYDNYLIWVQPYIAIAEQLPTDMVCRDKQLKLRVDEHVTWQYYHTSDLLNITKGTGWNSSVQTMSLEKEVESEAIELLNQEKALRKEQNELIDYVNESMDKLGTTVRLRKTWPQALQKYIPAEPVRAKRKSKEEQEELFDAPTDAIKLRMTQNLLEN